MSRTPRLCRMVVRVDSELPDALNVLAARLFNETRNEFSHSAIVRGLIAIGLASLADAPRLAPLFVAARVKRGRKPGRQPSDLNLEFEDQHNERLARGVVARAARRSPRPVVVPRGRTSAEHDEDEDEHDEDEHDEDEDEDENEDEDDENTDPGMELDDADTADGEPEGS